MFKKWLLGQSLKPITELVKAVLELFKDNKGKYSSKRTVAGVIVLAASADMQLNGLTYMNLALCFIGVLPICLSVFEKSESAV